MEIDPRCSVPMMHCQILGSSSFRAAGFTDGAEEMSRSAYGFLKADSAVMPTRGAVIPSGEEQLASGPTLHCLGSGGFCSQAQAEFTLGRLRT